MLHLCHFPQSMMLLTMVSQKHHTMLRGPGLTTQKLLVQEDGAPAGRGGPAGEGQAADCIATRFVDDAVLSALSIVNMDLRQDYRQAVLLGCGMDTRPFRCCWVS